MKNTLKGYLIGALSTIILLSTVVYAAGTTKTLNVVYDNIKIYKDNILTQAKGADGSVIEPFIHNGTTYLPVRGVANLAGMEVTWDGATKSVYLWDKIKADGTYLMEVCPPYRTPWHSYKDYLQNEGQSFEMAGTSYTNGFVLDGSGNEFVLFNLDGKYSTINMAVGPLASVAMPSKVFFFLDDTLIKEMDIDIDDLPENVSLKVEGGLQLKILVKEKENYPTYYNRNVGFGNITVE